MGKFFKKKSNVSQDSSMIKTRVSDHSSKKNCIDLKFLSMSPNEIRRVYMQKKSLYH